jgi:autotransporter-associated beta strand protein
LFATVLLGGVSAQATNYYWTNSVPADYGTAAAWSPSGGPPNATNAVAYTTNNASITYSAADNYELEQLQLGVLSGNSGGTNSGGTFTMNGGSLVITVPSGDQGALSVGGQVGTDGGNYVTNTTGTFNLNGGSLLVIRNQSTFYQDAVDIGAGTNCTGTLNVNGGVFTNLSNMQIGLMGNGFLNIGGGVVIENSGLLYIGDGSSSGGNPLNISGTFNLSSGALYILRNTNHEPVSWSKDGGLGIDRQGTNGTVNISGGALYCSRIGTGFGGSGSGAGGNPNNPTETLNICGGDIYIGFAGVTNINAGGAHTVQVNISGGTFHTVDLVEQTNTDVTQAGNTNTAILADGTNWTWGANMPVNLANSSFSVIEPSGTYYGPGYVTFAPEANRTITLNNVWSGQGGFDVNGPGTVNVGSGLQNTGGITVSNGTLVADGTIPNSCGITNYGALCIGASPTNAGTLTASNVTIEAGATLDYMLNTATTTGSGINDLLVVSNLTLGANSVLNVIDLTTPTVGGTYVVAQYVYRNGSFGVVTDAAGDTFTVSYANNEILLTVNSVGSGQYSWTAASEADWSVATDWNLESVPNGYTNDVVLLTNGVTCDYSAGDTNWISQMVLGPLDNSTGTFSMSGGTLSLTNPSPYPLIVGGGGSSFTSGITGANSVGSFTMSGGTLNVVRSSSPYEYQDGFVLGMGTNSTGTFTLSGGTANFLCGIEIGINGSGVLNVNGGLLIDNGWFHVGNGAGVAGGMGSGTFNLTSGAVYILPGASPGSTYAVVNGGLAINQAVTNAVVNISGGSLYCYRIGLDGITNNIPSVGSTNTLNISGGLIYVGAGGVGSNTAAGTIQVQSVNISGGTFHTADMLMTGTNSVSTTFPVGGANGSTNNILSDGTNWTWTVNLPVNLTNSIPGMGGVGYVTFAPEANRFIALYNNWSGIGGMNFAGPGRVVLAGANNTYTGNTTVSGGTLSLYNTSGSTSPEIIIAGGATFDVSSLLNTNVVAGFTNIFLLASGQTLSNSSSTAIIKGSVNSGSGTISLTYASGTPSFTVTNGTLTLSAGTVFSVNNTGSALGSGTYTLIGTEVGGVVVGTVPSSYVVGGNGVSGTSSLVISNNTLDLVVVAATTVVSPIISSPTVNGSGNPTFSGTGASDSTKYGVESTTSLSGSPLWIEATNVATPGAPGVTTLSNGSWSFTDANQTNPPTIFYRLYNPDTPGSPPQ